MKPGQIAGVAVAIFTLFGMVWAVFSKPASWDQTTRDVAELKPRVQDHSERIAVIEAHYTDIKDSLKQINKKLDE